MTDNRDLYTKYEAAGRCYFCNNTRSHVFYVPSLHLIKVNGPKDDMRSYDVCHKCLGRVQRRGSITHTELCQYVHQLESRGSVRGRLAIPKTTVIDNINDLAKHIETHVTVELDGDPVTYSLYVTTDKIVLVIN